MKKTFIKKASIAALAAALPLSAVADAGGDNWSISGWINEGMTYYDDGVGSDIVQVTDNGTTLASRITLSGSTELPNSGLTAGFEVILEPQSTTTPLIFSNQSTFSDTNGHAIGVLGNSINIGGSFGKVTVGLQSMPTDNIAVLEDPSLTLWSSISPVFRGNGFTIQSGSGAVWGNFLNCFTATGLRGAGGIGIDCNGIYRNGIRYDLPAFGPVTVAVGYANDDIYDVSAKYKGDLMGLKASVALGYAINQGANAGTISIPTGGITAADITLHNEAENFQVQAGLMDPGTGIFGSIAYQHEEADIIAGGQAAVNAAAIAAGLTGAGTVSDDSDAYWLKVGVKRAFNSLGDTSFAFQYGSYNDQYGVIQAGVGVTGSEVERIGFEVNQYFGSRLILYGVWENLDLDVDGNAAATTFYGGAEELDTFTAGLTFFF